MNRLHRFVVEQLPPAIREILLHWRRRLSNGFHTAVAAGTTRYNNNNMNVLKNEVQLASQRPAVQLVH